MTLEMDATAKKHVLLWKLLLSVNYYFWKVREEGMEQRLADNSPRTTERQSSRDYRANTIISAAFVKQPTLGKICCWFDSNFDWSMTIKRQVSRSSC
jgi:hypothetical protein